MNFYGLCTILNLIESSRCGMYKYKLINLNYLINHNENDIKQFLRFNGINKFDENDIKSMLKISNYLDKDNRVGFNISYIISRLEKEFDLVKIGNEIIVDIELKLTKKDIEQCKKNYKLFKQHYDGYDINIICYECESNNLYIYDNNSKKLEQYNYEKLNNILSKIINFKMLDINININSIYMNPTFFFEQKYELSNSQNITKGKIMNGLDNDSKKIILVCGRAGTGKTLLALDLLEEFKTRGKDVVYLTPFKINSIISSELIRKYGMKTVKQFLTDNQNFDYAIIDEAQRLKYSDIEVLEERINKRAILIGDINQNIDSESCFEELYYDRSNNEIYNMNQVIRTDDTFDLFAKRILGISTNGVKRKVFDRSKIQIEMFSEDGLNSLEEYVLLEPAKSLYFNDCRTECDKKNCYLLASRCIRKSVPYNVIGKEYDKVAILFCSGITIKNGEITSIKKVCYGNLKKQIYSIITRCTQSLKFLQTILLCIIIYAKN